MLPKNTPTIIASILCSFCSLCQCQLPPSCDYNCAPKGTTCLYLFADFTCAASAALGCDCTGCCLQTSSAATTTPIPSSTSAGTGQTAVSQPQLQPPALASPLSVTLQTQPTVQASPPPLLPPASPLTTLLPPASSTPSSTLSPFLAPAVATQTAVAPPAVLLPKQSHPQPPAAPPAACYEPCAISRCIDFFKPFTCDQLMTLMGCDCRGCCRESVAAAPPMPAAQNQGWRPLDGWNIPGAEVVHGDPLAHAARHNGACRTRGAQSSRIEEVWGVNLHMDCRVACADRPDCVAYEFAKIGTYTRCEIHLERVTHTMPMAGYYCYQKDVLGAAVTGGLSKQPSANSPQSGAGAQWTPQTSTTVTQTPASVTALGAAPTQLLLSPPVLATAAPPVAAAPSMTTTVTTAAPAVAAPRTVFRKTPCLDLVAPGASFATCPDLRGVDLTGANLQGAIMDYVDLTGAVLTRANLKSASLREVHANNALFSMTRLNEANLFKSDLRQADFSGAILDGADLSATRIAGAKFVWSSMENVKVQYVDDAIGATFENAKLGGSSVIESKLFEVNLKGADLRAVKFDTVRLDRSSFDKDTKTRGATFSRENVFENAMLDGAVFDGLLLADPATGTKFGANGASMKAASFRNVQLLNADMRGVDAPGADFSSATLVGAEFGFAQLQGAVFIGANLEDSKFLSVGIDSADFSNANIVGAEFAGAHGTPIGITLAAP